MSKSKEIYILGKNSLDKTNLLKKMVLEAVNLSQSQIEANIYKNNELKSNVLAYGSNRLSILSDFDKTGVATLFLRRNDYSLCCPTMLFKDVLLTNLHKKSIKDDSNTITVDDLIKFFSDVVEINFKYIRHHLYIDDSEFNIDEVGVGDSAILLLLSDILCRLINKQPNVCSISELEGSIFIEDIDMLLHPTLCYYLVSRLRKALPKVNLIMTTNNPVIITGSSKDAEFVCVYGTRTRATEYNWFKSSMISQVLTSQLFELEYSGMREQLFDDTIDVDTCDDNLSSMIHKQIRKKIAASDKYPSVEQVNKWINEALEQND